MKLKYYVSKVPNFGDDLNGVLWPHFAPDLFDEDETDAFIGIGTIIGFPCSPQTRLNVFSSGAGNDPIRRWADSDVTFWCVRGPLSARLLGLPDDRAISDGAVLSPLAKCFPRTRTGSRDTLLIPHWQSLADPGWDRVSALTGYDLVDPRGSPEQVIGRIAGAGCVITESLHGAILADTYGVPWVPFATTGNFQVSKWLDWALSCGRGLTLSIVPPPHADGLMRFGRPAAEFGSRIAVTEDAAMREMRSRTAERRPQRFDDRAKGWIKGTGLLNRFLAMSPERTAESLVDLASRAETPSSETTIADLQGRMLDRLDQLRRHARERSDVSKT